VQLSLFALGLCLVLMEAHLSNLHDEIHISVNPFNHFDHSSYKFIQKILIPVEIS